MADDDGIAVRALGFLPRAFLVVVPFEVVKSEGYLAIGAECNLMETPVLGACVFAVDRLVALRVRAADLCVFAVTFDVRV